MKQIKKKSKKKSKVTDMGKGFLGKTQKSIAEETINQVMPEPSLKDYGMDAMEGLKVVNEQIVILKSNTRRLSIFAHSLAIHLLDVNNTMLNEFTSNRTVTSSPNTQTVKVNIKK